MGKQQQQNNIFKWSRKKTVKKQTKKTKNNKQIVKNQQNSIFKWSRKNNIKNKIKKKKHTRTVLRCWVCSCVALPSWCALSCFHLCSVCARQGVWFPSVCEPASVPFGSPPGVVGLHVLLYCFPLHWPVRSAGNVSALMIDYKNMERGGQLKLFY